MSLYRRPLVMTFKTVELLKKGKHQHFLFHTGVLCQVKLKHLKCVQINSSHTGLIHMHITHTNTSEFHLPWTDKQTETHRQADINECDKCSQQGVKNMLTVFTNTARQSHMQTHTHSPSVTLPHTHSQKSWGQRWTTVGTWRSCSVKLSPSWQTGP